MNSIGTNIFRKYGSVGNSISNPITDFINDVFASAVASTSFKFGEYFNDEGMYIEPDFADICVDGNGIVTVVERLNGKIYQYDQDGNMLVAFGGLGEKTGTFTRPSAIDVDSKGNLYWIELMVTFRCSNLLNLSSWFIRQPLPTMPVTILSHMSCGEECFL